MHSRNVQQILGEHPGISEPSSFVVCWTDRPRSSIGGTMFGVILAESYSIPVFNFFEPETYLRFGEFFTQYI